MSTLLNIHQLSWEINKKTIFSYFTKTNQGFNINTHFEIGILNYSIDQNGLISRNQL